MPEISVQPSVGSLARLNTMIRAKVAPEIDICLAQTDAPERGATRSISLLVYLTVGSKMRAIVLNEFLKDVGDIVVSDQPDPVPHLDQYKIEIRACAANFFDLLQIRGRYQTQPQFPWVAGFEFAGIIVSVPKTGIITFKKGDRVFGAAQGAYATFICAKGSEIQRMPERWDFEAAAGLFLTGPTSFAALKLRANIQKGEWVLIHGASGGVGLSAVQVAKALGGKVIATTTGIINIAACKAFGADFVIDYVAIPKWETEVLNMTKGRGVDIVLDPVGLISQSLKCAAWCARLVTIGFAGGKIEAIPLNRVLLKNVSIVGVHWGAYAQSDPDAIPQVWKELFQLIERDLFRGIAYQPDSVGHRRFQGLEDVSRALRGLERKEIWGKAVINLCPREDGSL